MDAAELIVDAIAKADLCPVDVRKASLLCIARVQTAVAPEQAPATLEAGLALNPGLSPGLDLGFEQLSWFTVAAVSPWRLRELPRASAQGMSYYDSNQAARVMSEHGHAGYLRTFILQGEALAEVPLEGIAYLLGRTTDFEEQRFLLRRAAQAWRETEQDDSFAYRQMRHQFFPLFRAWRSVMPREEALAVLDEIVQRVLERPDPRVHGQIGEVSFSSVYALEIFQLFNVLVELHPERAHELVALLPELACAVRRYPNGLKSMEEEAEAERAKQPPRDPNQGGAFIMGVDLDYGMALLEADRTGDFSPPLEYARISYLRDTDAETPNMAPKAFWPSTSIYRTIFYQWGRVSAETASQKLDSVPDAELSLFAQIELAAAWCGLPALASVTMSRHRSEADRDLN